ncbi:hypothetical protein RVS70_05420 [Virgibacillus sp. M23]|nr:hypothetical protein [Virgibacillus sp. M23]
MLKILKDAIRLNDKYKAVMLDLDREQLNEDDVVFQIRFELDTLKYGSSTDEQLEDEGYTEGQIKRMKGTAIKHLEGLLDKYGYDLDDKI